MFEVKAYVQYKDGERLTPHTETVDEGEIGNCVDEIVSSFADEYDPARRPIITIRLWPV